MPMDYFCESCGLVFSVGLYATRSRYPARTLLVCRSCGTVHELQQPLNTKNSTRLMAQSCPLVLEEKPDLPVFTRRLSWNECSLPEGFSEKPLHDDEGWICQELTCSHCHQTGTLTERWERDDKKCPACHEERLATTGGWIT